MKSEKLDIARIGLAVAVDDVTALHLRSTKVFAEWISRRTHQVGWPEPLNVEGNAINVEKMYRLEAELCRLSSELSSAMQRIRDRRREVFEAVFEEPK